MTKVIFVGNCQAQALYGAYLTWIAPGRDETVQYVPAYEEADAAAIDSIRQADLIALQITDADQKVNLADIGARGRVVRFPMVTAMFLWPFHSGAHPRDADIPAEYRRVFTGNFGDRWLDRRLAAGEDPRAIVDQYRQPAVVSEARLDRMIELVAQKQQERDTQADMKLGDYIMGRLTTERVFIHLHHPNLALFQLMLREVFARMDCTTAEIERAVGAYRASPFPPEEPPVHPRIAEHLGLHWATPDLAYRFYFGERLTWETFCARYVAHDWNQPLQHCLSFAHRDVPRAELERIVTELEPAAARYDSSEGYFALSDMRRRLGDLPGSMAALDRALASDPLSLPCLARRAELLLETDRAEEGMQAARDLVSWQPGFVQARITLFEIYSRLGQLHEALDQARASLKLEPHHPHILHRLADFERALASQHPT